MQTGRVVKQGGGSKAGAAADANDAAIMKLEALEQIAEQTPNIVQRREIGTE